MDLHLPPTLTRSPPGPWAGVRGAAPAPARAGSLEGATATGEAARRQLAVRIGLWLDEAGRVRRARWRPGPDAALASCAELACALVEAGVDPARLDAAALSGVGDPDRAELAAAAVRCAAACAGPG